MMMSVQWPISVFRKAIAMALVVGCAHPVSTGEQTVSFRSTDQDLTGGNPTMLSGLLLRPPGNGPFPAVVLMHSCNGLREPDGSEAKRFYVWARHLRDEGFVTLLVDSYGPRGLQRLCPLPERERPIKTDRERVRDAYGALLYLQSRKDVRAQDVGAMGWSNGGQAVLWTIADSNRERPASLPQGDFRAALSLYPGGCRLAQQAQWNTKVPFLMLVGEADDYTEAKPCVDLASSARASGAPVDITLFPGAHHAFDEPDMPLHIVSDVVLADGRSPTMGTNPKARDAAMARVPAYFKDRLAR